MSHPVLEEAQAVLKARKGHIDSADLDYQSQAGVLRWMTEEAD